MSMNPAELNANWTPPQPPRSSGMKWFLGMGCGCLVVLLLCCGGGIALTVTSIKVNKEAPAAEALLKEMADVDMFEGFRPEGSIRIALPVVDIEFMAGVLYLDAKTSSTMIFGRTSLDIEQAKMQITQSFKQQSDNQQRQLVDTKVNTVEVVVRGKPSNFVLVEGTDSQTKRQRLQASGIFDGKRGPVLFLFDGDAATYPKDSLIDFLKAIK